MDQSVVIYIMELVEKESVLSKRVAALEAKEAGQPAVQQLKPKMPSEVEIIANINSGFVTIREQAIYRLGVEWCYKYIAQHFGH
jgi:hypothetical protein